MRGRGAARGDRGAARRVLAVDIGGTKMAFLSRPAGGGPITPAVRVPTPARAGVAAILRVIDAQVAALPGGRAALAALGVSVPGHVDPAGRVLRAGNLAGWRDVPLRARLEARHRVPVYVERDANCGALGERWCGAATGLDEFVFLSLGTGVGVGLFLGGRLHRGAHCAAGEAGDIAFPSGDTVGGALSRRAIVRAARRASGREMSTGEALARATREPRLDRAMRRAIADLASAVAAIAALLDPEAVVIGGGTSHAGAPLLGRVRRLVPPQLRRTRVMLAGLGSESPLYGALFGACALLGEAPPRPRPPRRARR